MDPTTITVLISAVSAASGGVLTLLLTKGVEAWLKVRADNRTDVVREETTEDTNLRFIINRQDLEIANLKSELKEVNKQHGECEKQHAELRTELRLRMEFVNQRVANVENEVKQTNKTVADNAKGDSWTADQMLIAANPEKVAKVLQRNAEVSKDV